MLQGQAKIVYVSSALWDQRRQMANDMSRVLKDVDAIFGGGHATLCKKNGSSRIGLQLPSPGCFFADEFKAGLGFT